jgi:hypothetical protein
MTTAATTAIDSFVSDSDVVRELGITLQTVFRWDRSPSVVADGWPPKIKIGTRNYRSRAALNEFKANVLRRALAERNQVAA